MKTEPSMPATPNSSLINAPFHPALMNPQLQALMQQQHSIVQQQLLQQAAAQQPTVRQNVIVLDRFI